MPNASTDGVSNQPQSSESQSFERRHVVRIAAAAAAAAAGVGYLINDLGNDILTGMAGIARVLAAVAGTALVLWISEAGRDRRLARLEARLEARLDKAERAEGYLDGVQHTMTEMRDSNHLRSVR